MPLIRLPRWLGLTSMYSMIISTAPPSPVMVLINPSSTGTVLAGSRYTLTCIASKTTSGLTQSAQTQWTGPNGAPLATNGSTVLAAATMEPLRTVQNIVFGSLSTSDAGMYMCQSTLSSPALTTPYQTMQTYTITISGKL